MSLFLFTDINNYCIIDNEIFYINFYLNKNLIFYNQCLANFYSNNEINFFSAFSEVCINLKCKSLFSIFEIKKLRSHNLLLCCDLMFNSYFLII